MVPGRNSIGRPKNVERETLSLFLSLEKKKRETRGERENAEKSAVDAGYSWKEDPPGDDMGPRASIRASVLSRSLAFYLRASIDAALAAGNNAKSPDTSHPQN